VEDVFYLRPPGYYIDRQGDKYVYTQEDIREDISDIILACEKYDRRRLLNYNEEHIRDLLPQAIRQHFVVTMNLRSVLHFMDLRAKRDAQLEIQALCELMWPIVKKWAPNVCAYYEEKRLHKAKLSP
jgi:thymidylate synthase (FAD)